MTDKAKKEKVGKDAETDRELTDSEMDQIAGGDPQGAPVGTRLDHLYQSGSGRNDMH